MTDHVSSDRCALSEPDAAATVAAEAAVPDGCSAGMSARERALQATDVSFAISDPGQPDNPLVWVNPAFTATTGYESAEVVGSNCRFLQGPNTDPASVAAISAAIAAHRPITITLRNYRKDGSEFWNQLSLSPVHDAAGRVINFLGVQADVSDSVASKLARQEALEAARTARVALEATNARLRLLSESSRQLVSSLDAGQTLQRLCRVVVPALGRWCITYTADDSGELESATVHHADAARDPDIARIAEEIGGRLITEMRPDSVVQELLRTGGAVRRLDRIDRSRLLSSVGEGLTPLIERLGAGTTIAAPMWVGSKATGVLVIVAAEGTARYPDEDVELVADIAGRAALAINHARLYARDHSVAETLQRSLLPVLPTLPGIATYAEYLPGTARADVGGDWYDLLGLPDGAVGLAIGDVMGHDLAAAAAMGQLRSVLRSYAWEGDDPGRVLDRLDHLVQGLGMAQLASCVYARLEPAAMPGGDRVLRYSNAGHPPPALLDPNGDVRFLEHGHSVLIGVDATRRSARQPRSMGSTTVRPGTMLLLYTDGLVERRDRSLDEGLAAMARTLREHKAEAGPQAVVDELVGPLRNVDRGDDVAVLAVCVD